VKVKEDEETDEGGIGGDEVNWNDLLTEEGDD
jgi:hypothetical protein